MQAPALVKPPTIMCCS